MVDDDGLLEELHVLGIAIRNPVAQPLVVAVDAIGGELGHERGGVETHTHVEHFVTYIGIENQRTVDVIIDAVVSVKTTLIVHKDALDGELLVPTAVDAQTFVAGALPFFHTDDSARTHGLVIIDRLVLGHDTGGGGHLAGIDGAGQQMIGYKTVKGVATMGIVAIEPPTLLREGGTIDGLGIGYQFVKGGDACRTEGFICLDKRRIAKAPVLGLGTLLALSGIVVDGFVIDIGLVHVSLQRVVKMRQPESCAEKAAFLIGLNQVGKLLGGGKQHTVHHLNDAVLHLLVLENDARIAVDVIIAGNGVDIDLDETGIHIGRTHHTIV